MTSIAGIILAGGRSSRMGAEKALMDFHGAPLIGRAIARLAPQVAALAISANGDPARFARFGLAVIADADEEPLGPLAGIAAGLRFARDNGCAFLATAPCDAPFAPRGFVGRLLASRGPSGIAIAGGARGPEPLFGLWSITALPRVEAAMRDGELAARRLAHALGAAVVPIETAPGEPDWALNLNRPEDATAARAFASGLSLAADDGKS